MKIVFLGFASSFTPGMTYQDNMLCEQALKDGNDVTYLSNPEGYVNGELRYLGPQDTVLSNGLHLIRIPYVKFGNKVLSKKVRVFRGVFRILEKEKPDVIFCHNTQYWPIIDAIKYKKKHPKTAFYADKHTASFNSGTNWLSLHILHRIYYRWLLQRAIPYLDKYFYVGESERLFACNNYKVPEAIMEYYPLGGVVPSKEQYQFCRRRIREELGIRDNMKLYIHSGKLDEKKRTEELLRAYSSVKDENSKLIIIGSIPVEMESKIRPLIEADNRIIYLGWKLGDVLQEYLCACDLYCQPGSVSATMQNAVCKGCAIMAYPHLPYKTNLDWGNILWVETSEDIEKVFLSLSLKPEQLDILKRNSRNCGETLLDYRKLAARIYM